VIRVPWKAAALVKGYRDLELWKKAHKFVLRVYDVTSQFPDTEKFGIVSQVRPAAYSIPSNIAEGFGRRSTKELLQMLAIAMGRWRNCGIFFF
jgi:four helix bundle protein